MRSDPTRPALGGKRALITGAANGIGRATALLFARAEARLVLADVDRDGLRGTRSMVEAVGGSAHTVVADVRRPAAIRGLVERAAGWLGGIDVIVSNAGIQRVGLVESFAARDWDELMAVNARSCFLGAKYGVPYLRAAGGGSIVNVASLDGLKGGRGNSAYSASKGAVIAFTRALAMELALEGIRVNCVCPGWIDNAFNEPTIAFLGGRTNQERLVRSSVPMGRQGTNGEAAEAILFLASDASSYITGQALVVDGGVY